MIEQLKILIVINCFLTIVSTFTKKKIIQYFLPLVLIAIPLLEYFNDIKNVNKFIYVKVLLAYLILKLFRDIKSEIHKLSDAGTINNIVLLMYLSLYTVDDLLNYLIILTISILGVGLVRKHKKESFPLHLYNFFLGVILVFINYSLDNKYIYIVYFALVVINSLFLLLWIPFRLLKNECNEKSSYFIYAYLAILLTNIVYISPKIEMLMYKVQPLDGISNFMMPLISIVLFIYWMTNFHLTKKLLSEKIFNLYMSQLSLAFFLGFSFNENTSEIIIGYVTFVTIFYILLRESLFKNTISDLSLFVLAICGIVAFPITNIFYIKLEYISFMNHKLNWFSIFLFILASLFNYNSLIYFYESFKESYVSSGIKLKKLELTIFTIVIFLLPRYII